MIVTRSALWRELVQLLHIATSEHYLLGLDGSGQPGHYIGNIPALLFLTLLYQRLVSQVALISSVLVGKVTQFHRLHNAIHDQGRP